MIFKALLVFVSLSVTTPYAFAREGRGEHKTQVQCTISTKKSAKDCIKKVAQNMPSENDANAAFLTNSQEAKDLLIELLKGQEKSKDIKYVQAAAYIGIVVQNDDEESIYYYALASGAGKPRLVGETIAITDLYFYVCEEKSYPPSMITLDGLLLGQKPESTLLGKVWLPANASCNAE